VYLAFARDFLLLGFHHDQCSGHELMDEAEKRIGTRGIVNDHCLRLARRYYSGVEGPVISGKGVIYIVFIVDDHLFSLMYHHAVGNELKILDYDGRRLS
jgi:hypothetical protein